MRQPVIPRASLLLYRWRTRRKWSQTDAAAHIGLDQARYTQLERGVRRAGLDWAVRIEQRTGRAVPVAAWSSKFATPRKATRPTSKKKREQAVAVAAGPIEPPVEPAA
jgi:transcriptional regulator with XRE-family HTH domain